MAEPLVNVVAKAIYDADIHDPRFTWEDMQPQAQMMYKQMAIGAMTVFYRTDVSTEELDLDLQDV